MAAAPSLWIALLLFLKRAHSQGRKPGCPRTPEDRPLALTIGAHEGAVALHPAALLDSSRLVYCCNVDQNIHAAMDRQDHSKRCTAALRVAGGGRVAAHDLGGRNSADQSPLTPPKPCKMSSLQQRQAPASSACPGPARAHRPAAQRPCWQKQPVAARPAAQRRGLAPLRAAETAGAGSTGAVSDVKRKARVVLAVDASEVSRPFSLTPAAAAATARPAAADAAPALPPAGLPPSSASAPAAPAAKARAP